MTRKGQHIVFGSIFLLFIFFLVVTIFFDDLFHGKELQSSSYDVLQREATRAADSLVREGYPLSWDEDTVRRVGLATDGAFDDRKHQAFQELSVSRSAHDIKRLLGVQHDYVLIITEEDGERVHSSDGFTSEQDLTSSNPSFLATQRRTLHDPQGGSVTITLHLYIP